MSPRGRPVTVSDDAILNAARDVFLARGVDATTTEIAQRAKISESVIFHRYKTKEALFRAVVDRHFVPPPAFDKLTSWVGRGDIADHLLEVGIGLVEASKRVLPFVMMAFCSRSKLVDFHDRSRWPHPVRVRMIRMLAGYFEAELRLGRLRAAEPEILARMFFGGVVQYVLSEHIEASGDALPIPPATYLRAMIHILLEGAGTRRSSRARKR